MPGTAKLSIDGNSYDQPVVDGTEGDRAVAIRKLLPTVGQDAEILAACFGRKSKKRVDQVAAILDTLKTLGLII